MNTSVFVSQVYAQSGEITSGLPSEVQIFLALVNAGAFVLGVWGFVKGLIVPGYIYDQALSRENGVKDELTALRIKVDEKILPELERSREAQNGITKLLDRFVPLIEKFIVYAERGDR